MANGIEGTIKNVTKDVRGAIIITFQDGREIKNKWYKPQPINDGHQQERFAKARLLIGEKVQTSVWGGWSADTWWYDLEKIN